ncbi:MAG: hypothetical protein O7B99_00450 [Planctomycetota bacterium]|nr:hypothetical protein [Planctomycetota bacterium]
MSSPRLLVALPLLVFVPAVGQEPEDATTEEAEPPEPEEVLPPSDAPGWAEQVEALAAAIEVDEASTEDANALYGELKTALDAELSRFRTALREAGSPSTTLGEMGLAEGSGWLELEPETTVAQLDQAVDTLYRARVRLLELVSERLRARVTGSGVEGMRELKGELRHIQLQLRYHRLETPGRLAELGENVRIAPLPTLFGFLVLGVAVIVFRRWRRWAPEGLDRARHALRNAWPEGVWSQRLSTFLWYAKRVRRPIEWALLLAILFGVFSLGEIGEFKLIARIVLRWILVAWLAVVLIDAMVIRGAWHLSKERSRLRLRSFRLIAAWLVFLGLGLQLAEHYAGEASIHAWVWMLFEVLALPVALVLLLNWRRVIFAALEREALDSPIAAGLLDRRGGLGSLVAAVGGTLFLVALWLLRRVLLTVSSFEGGRRLTAGLLRREAVRRTDARFGSAAFAALSDERRARLVEGKGGLVEDVAGDELDRLADLVDRTWGAATVVAERGGGKTTLLRRLAARFGDEGIIVDCSAEGFQATRRAFAHELGLEETASNEAIGVCLRKLRFAAFDNIHRLTRPVVGGRREFESLAGLARSLGTDLGVTWVTTMDSAAWQYNLRARAGLMLGTVMHLPPWTEGQIGDLVELRSGEAGIRPDFGRLALPRRLQEDDVVAPENRNRRGFYRVLWLAADGNPAVALRIWADSLAIVGDGSTFVRFASLPAIAEIEGASLNMLLILRLLAQTELATLDEITEGLDMPRSDLTGALIIMLQRGWIEEVEGGYRIAWKWFRTVTRVLARRNLLTSDKPKLVSTSGGSFLDQLQRSFG